MENAFIPGRRLEVLVDRPSFSFFYAVFKFKFKFSAGPGSEPCRGSVDVKAGGCTRLPFEEGDTPTSQKFCPVRWHWVLRSKQTSSLVICSIFILPFPLSLLSLSLSLSLSSLSSLLSSFYFVFCLCVRGRKRVREREKVLACRSRGKTFDIYL